MVSPGESSKRHEEGETLAEILYHAPDAVVTRACACCVYACFAYACSGPGDCACASSRSGPGGIHHLDTAGPTRYHNPIGAWRKLKHRARHDRSDHRHRHVCRRLPRVVSPVTSASPLTLGLFRSSSRASQEALCTAHYAGYDGFSRYRIPGRGVATLCRASSVNTCRPGIVSPSRTNRSAMRGFRVFPMEWTCTFFFLLIGSLKAPPCDRPFDMDDMDRFLEAPFFFPLPLYATFLR